MGASTGDGNIADGERRVSWNDAVAYCVWGEARSSNNPDSSTSNPGFRTVAL